ncbi:1,2-phenylacetyl-CoA epoxidase subunit PaaE [Paraflavisolibacter sp. H34]|uniref:1,2-phenylacetyl-CoA epoxidase subunit PaaE n=1 Tax=Huijunlia imazamoxiresistens TaxID=3127457 RepID=UPI003015DF1C
MIHFHSLSVKKVERETEDCVSLTFDVPPELAEVFCFKQGQSLTIRKTMGGQEVRRTYSICSSPLEQKLQVAVKRQEGGVFSTWANQELKAGDKLEVMPPVGAFFTELHPAQKKNYVAFAAGSGITPILSLIRTTLLTEPHSTFTLVYGNRTKSSIIFKEQLEALKDKFLTRFRIVHILSREKTESELNHGRIDRAKCALLFEKLIDKDACDEFFLCGPEQMIFTVKAFLEEKGVPPARLHFELFTVPGQETTGNEQPATGKEKTNQAQVQIKIDGILFSFGLEYNGQTILNAGLAEGADLPYACKGGVCTTCKAKLLEGKVEMDANWGLEPDEVEKGFVLTCQSHPASEKVVLDYDAK